MTALLVIVVLSAAVALAFLATTGGRGLTGRGSRPARRRPAGHRPRRARRHRPHRSTDERVLLAEGEDIQDEVEARLRARGVAPHRLSGPNPPIPAERLANPPIPGERLATSHVHRQPHDAALPPMYTEPGIGVPPEVVPADQAALDEQELRGRRARRSITGGR
jgi:hypothetical protein